MDHITAMPFDIYAVKMGLCIGQRLNRPLKATEIGDTIITYHFYDDGGAINVTKDELLAAKGDLFRMEELVMNT